MHHFKINHMTSVQKKQLKVLNETIEAYNVNTRCTNEEGDCKYYVEGKQGCAIGRLIEDVELKKKLDSGGFTMVDNDCVFIQLPKEIQELGQDFLTRLQCLHDNKENWGEQGLSENGEDTVEYIKELFNLV